MLALIGKLAALYAERMRDGVVIDAVNDIENLTTGLAGRSAEDHHHQCAPGQDRHAARPLGEGPR
jgi:hypothetical protein